MLFVMLQGSVVLEKVGGLHKFMGWRRALLTVSTTWQPWQHRPHQSVNRNRIMVSYIQLGHNSSVCSPNNTWKLSLFVCMFVCLFILFIFVNCSGQWWVSNGVTTEARRNHRGQRLQLGIFPCVSTPVSSVAHTHTQSHTPPSPPCASTPMSSVATCYIQYSFIALVVCRNREGSPRQFL